MKKIRTALNRARIIAVTMQKGGVGKTTTVLSLGTALSELGYKVLLIDIDPQANLTEGLGVTEYEYSVYEVLLNPERSAEFAILRDIKPRLDIIPSNLALAGAELELAGKIGRETLLQRSVIQVAGDYDFILIDSPPSLGIFTLNALFLAQDIITPVQAQVFALKAMPQLEETLKLVRRLHYIQILGVLMTMSDRRTSLAGLVEEKIRQQYGKTVFKTVIPVNTKLAEAPAAGMAIFDYAPSSTGATAYRELAKEVIDRYEEEQPF
jgi:chromosome partitioning protein